MEEIDELFKRAEEGNLSDNDVQKEVEEILMVKEDESLYDFFKKEEHKEKYNNHPESWEIHLGKKEIDYDNKKLLCYNIVEWDKEFSLLSERYPDYTFYTKFLNWEEVEKFSFNKDIDTVIDIVCINNSTVHFLRERLKSILNQSVYTNTHEWEDMEREFEEQDKENTRLLEDAPVKCFYNTIGGYGIYFIDEFGNEISRFTHEVLEGYSWYSDSSPDKVLTHRGIKIYPKVYRKPTEEEENRRKEREKKEARYSKKYYRITKKQLEEKDSGIPLDYSKLEEVIK